MTVEVFGQYSPITGVPAGAIPWKYVATVTPTTSTITVTSPDASEIFLTDIVVTNTGTVPVSLALASPDGDNLPIIVPASQTYTLQFRLARRYSLGVILAQTTAGTVVVDLGGAQI